MKEIYTRTAALLGENGVKKLNNSHVAVFGLGGVGSFVAEALARAGVGELTLVDADKVNLSNINRQLIALYSTVEKNKTEVMAKRISDINPDCKINVKTLFFNEDTADEFDFTKFSYVADAIDSIKSKVFLICSAKRANVPVISCMGAGNKLDATAFKVADIENTKICPLAKIVRRELKKRGVFGVKTVYSEELPITADKTNAVSGEKFIGSVSFVPSVAGLILAGEIIKDIVNV